MSGDGDRAQGPRSSSPGCLSVNSATSTASLLSTAQSGDHEVRIDVSNACKCVHCTCKCCKNSKLPGLLSKYTDGDSSGGALQRKRFYVSRTPAGAKFMRGARKSEGEQFPFFDHPAASPNRDASMKVRQQMLSDIRQSLMAGCPFVKGVSLAPLSISPSASELNEVNSLVDDGRGIWVDVTFNSKYSDSVASSLQISGFSLAEAPPKGPPIPNARGEVTDVNARKPLPVLPINADSTVSSSATVYYSLDRVPDATKVVRFTGMTTGLINEPIEVNSGIASRPPAASSRGQPSIDGGATMTTTLILQGLHCSHCASILQTALANRHGIFSPVFVNVGPPQTVIVNHHDSVTPKKLKDIMEDFGFAVVDSESRTLLQPIDGPSSTIANTSTLSKCHILKTTIDLNGLTCAACVASVAKILSETPGVVQPATVTLLPHQRAVVVHDNMKVDADGLREAVENAGFEVLEATSEINKPSGMSVANTNSIKQPSDEALEGSSVLNPDGSENFTTTKLLVTGMTCGGCVAKIEQGLYLDGVKDVSVSLSTRRANIRHDSAVIGVRDLIKEVEALGFSASVDVASSREAKHRAIQQREMKSLTLQVVIGFVLAIPTVIISMIIMMLLPPDNPTRMMFDEPIVKGLSVGTLILAVIATIVQFGLGWRFYVASYRSIRYTRSANMDVLITLGTTAAYGYSVVTVAVAMLSPKSTDDGNGSMSSDDQFFETSVLLIFFVLLGKLLESYAKRRTTDAVESLVKLAPREVTLVSCAADSRESGGIKILGERDIGIELVQIGDILKVVVGARVPCDGYIVRGSTAIDESLITGESIPIEKVPGDAVVGGSTNSQAVVYIKVTKAGNDTFLSRIAKLVEDAQTHKAPIEALTDRLSRVFVPIILVISFVTLLLWVILGPLTVPGLHGEMLASTAIRFAIAVLVVACPCALGLAVPTAVMVGSGIAARVGVLVKGGGAAMQAGEECRIVAFDKTGTLTEGKAKVTGWYVDFDGELESALGKGFWRSVQALTVESGHPLSRAVKGFAEEVEVRAPSASASGTSSTGIGCFPTANAVKEVAGRGICGDIELSEEVEVNGTYKVEAINFKLYIGNLAWMRENNIPATSSQLKAATGFEEEGSSLVFVGIVDDAGTLDRSGNPSSYVALVLGVSDVVRATAREAVRKLSQMGIQVHMLTGDSTKTAVAVAKKLGIRATNVSAELKPGDKEKRLKEIKASGVHGVSELEDGRSQRSCWRRMRAPFQKDKGESGTVIFVGDGINDSVALAASDVGIAVGAGSDVAIESASVVLTRSNPEDVVTFLELSGLTMRRVRWNLAEHVHVAGNSKIGKGGITAEFAMSDAAEIPELPATELPECCRTGYLWEGSMIGEETTVGGVPAYLSKSATPSDKWIVIWTDVFGFKVNNVRIIADAIAKAGFNVVVPDILNGDPIDPAGIEGLMDKPTSFMDRLSKIGKMVLTVPSFVGWMSRHNVKATLPHVHSVLEDVKNNHKAARIGTAGYCFGGRYTVLCGGNEPRVDVFYAAHPSLMAIPQDIVAISKPGYFALAEHDAYLSDGQVTKIKELLSSKDVQFKTYAGTKHGFAARASEKDEVARKARDEALTDMIAFFKSKL